MSNEMQPNGIDPVQQKVMQMAHHEVLEEFHAVLKSTYGEEDSDSVTSDPFYVLAKIDAQAKTNMVDEKNRRFMELPGHIKQWNEEQVGRAIILKNDETKALDLIGYILPTRERHVHLVALNNGTVIIGEADDSKKEMYKEEFAPNLNPYIITAKDNAALNIFGELTEQRVGRFVGLLEEKGMKIFVNTNNRSDLSVVQKPIADAIIVDAMRQADKLRVQQFARVSQIFGSVMNNAYQIIQENSGENPK
jgi:hypothetical protein